MNHNLESSIKEIGKGSIININWELVSHCQFKCTYCYYGPHKSNIDYTSLSKIVLTKLKTIKDDIKLTLVGGEPTLHPDFHNLIKNLYELDNIKEINIVTNFEQPLEFWQKIIPFNSKTKVVVSFHPEYPQKDAFEKIHHLSNDLNFDCVFVVHNNIKFFNKLIEYREGILKYFGENIPFNFVRAHYKNESGHHYFKYDQKIEEFLKEMNDLAIKRNLYEKVDFLVDSQWQSMSKFDFILNGLNALKGWNCKLRAFIIHKDGMVSRSCTSSKKYILLEDFKEKMISCPFNICECDDYWTFTKSKS